MADGEDSQEPQWRVNLSVKGKVQGVFYRASTMTEAQRLGVQGFVQNMEDGSVQVVARGTRAQLEELIAWCRHGPPLAKVSSVAQVEPMKICEDEMPLFRIKSGTAHESGDRPVHTSAGSELHDGLEVSESDSEDSDQH